MPVGLVVDYHGESETLRVDDQDVVVFPRGLVGFEDLHRFVVLDDPEAAPIAVLQSLDDTRISFLVTDPRYVEPAYDPRLADADLEGLGLAAPADGRLLCILAAKDGPARITANLLGPLMINSRTRLGRQIVLERSPYSAGHPVLTADEPAAVVSSGGQEATL